MIILLNSARCAYREQRKTMSVTVAAAVRECDQWPLMQIVHRKSRKNRSNCVRDVFDGRLDKKNNEETIVVPKH